MSLASLPDVALIQIFRTLDHIELVRLYYSLDSSERIQDLIHNCSYLWTNIHIKSTVDYNLFTCFSRLLISNASTTRELIVDELDLTCRKILVENKFSLKNFSQLEQLIIHDEYISNTLQSITFCLSTLKILRLTTNNIHLNHINDMNQLNTLQLPLCSRDILQSKFHKLTNLHLKIQFDDDHNSYEIFSRLPNEHLQILTLKFLLLNNDFNFPNDFHNYLNSCNHLHTLELTHLHSMCPLSLYRNINYSKYNRLILINICQLTDMRSFIEFNQYNLPFEYFQFNPTLNLIHYSSSIQNVYWHTRQLISIDYIHCVTASMEFLNQFDIIWLDKNLKSQTFESYILRSIYNAPDLISILRNLSISKFELSLNGLVTLMTSLPLLKDLLITDGKIDQMGSGMHDIEKIVHTIPNVSQSNIQTIEMNNIQMSRRTTVHLCLITQQLVSLIMNDVNILDKGVSSEQNRNYIRPSFLVLLKQITQYTDQFKWSHLKSLTLGKNMLNRHNLSSFIPSNMNHTYGININHICIIISNHRLFDSSDLFLKSIKKLIKFYPKLTSFILEFTKQYEGQCRLRNQLHDLFELNMNKKISVYPTIHDYACRFCFDTNLNDDDNDDDNQPSSQQYRTFCGIPLFQLKKQRKSNLFS